MDGMLKMQFNDKYHKKGQEVLKEFFSIALALQKEKSVGYGESWSQGRPVGVTDNMLWIIVRLRNMEKVLAFGELDDSEKRRIKDKIKDDLIDLAVFAGFRYALNDEELI